MNERFARDLHDSDFGGLESIVSAHEHALVDAGIEVDDDDDTDDGPALRITLVRGDGETFEAVCTAPILHFLQAEIRDGLVRMEL